MTVGFVAIARPTFDTAFAAEFSEAALDALTNAGINVLGTPDLALNDVDVETMAGAWAEGSIDALVVLQATFADSTLAAACAETTDAPIVLWGAPEPRTGDRLRRNSLCGINLAAFRLANDEHDYRYVYADPGDPGLAEMLDAALSEPLSRTEATTPRAEPSSSAAGLVDQLAAARIGVVGQHPAGFEPCGFDENQAQWVTGVTIEQIALDELFDVAGSIPDEQLEALRADIDARMDLGELDQESIEPSIRLHAGLRELCESKGWGAVASRCWPECFTEFGGAACTAQGLLTTLGIPAQCEADAYGAITALMLQNAANSVPFTADLVDIDAESDTAVVWHCGLAPFDMAAPGVQPSGTVHSNRQLPLVSEFALKGGTVTVARLSQSRGKIRLVLGTAEMLDVARPFSGTAGTLRFDRPAMEVLDTIMSEGLEHHYGLVYGDATDELRSVAAALSLEIVEL